MNDKKQLIEQLASDVRAIVLDAEKLKELTEEQFNQKRSDGGWSVAQVLEHLHFYCQFYLPLLERSAEKKTRNQNEFKSGWLGSYFTRLMKPNVNGEISGKMKSPANAIPQDKRYSRETLDIFLSEQHQLLDVLKNMAEADWNVRMPISISKLIRLKTGDVIQFVIAHEQRHMHQISKILKDF